MDHISHTSLNSTKVFNVETSHPIIPDAQQYFQEDFKDIIPQVNQTNQTQQQSTEQQTQGTQQNGFDPFGSVISSLFV